MINEIGEYLLSFLDKWFFWVGIVFLIPELFKKFNSTKELAEKLPIRLFWIFGGLCIFIATFQICAKNTKRRVVKELTYE